MSEKEWRQFGITMSTGWVHCGSHLNTPHILWFRRPLVRKTPFTVRQETRPRLTKSAGDLPKTDLPTVESASTVLKMRRLVIPDQTAFEKKKQRVHPGTYAIDLPLFNLSLKQPAAPSRTVTLRNSLQTREVLRL